MVIWLYDVIPVDLETEMLDDDYDHVQLRDIKDRFSNLKPKKLKRHLSNYNSLRTFVGQKQGRGIIAISYGKSLNQTSTITKI